MKMKELAKIAELWKEGCIAYRAGIHPRQNEITKALVEYLSEYPEDLKRLKERR